MLAPFANTVKYAGRNRPAGATPQTPDAEERQIEDVRRAARFARDKMRLNPAEASFAVSTQHDAHQVSVEYLAGIIGRIIEIEGPPQGRDGHTGPDVVGSEAHRQPHSISSGPRPPNGGAGT